MRTTFLTASGITATNATLNGAINPNGLATTAYLQYGLPPAALSALGQNRQKLGGNWVWTP